MDKEDIIEQMESLIRKGKDSYFIDQELKKYDLSPEEKGMIIARLQEYEVAYLKSTSGKTGAIIQIIVGSLILMIGYLSTFEGYAQSSIRYFIKFVAIIGGAIILWKGYRRYKSIVSSGEPSKFKKDRFKRYM